MLLHLGAVWCHWCHVMEETTYRDPRVLAQLQEGYVTIYVDHDARPDLSSRYEEYGWPATILFTARGEELAKLQGYLPPARMASLLAAFREDPTPGPSVRPPSARRFQDEAALSTALRLELDGLYLAGYDPAHGGWGRVHKYLDSDTVELALRRGAAGDAAALEMAQTTLDAALALFDPVWGGVYQYSDSGVWTNPHFEKIISFQTSYLRRYAAAYAQLGDERYATAAREVVRFLRGFLRSPEGAFYVSQDADLVKGEHSAAYFALDDAGRRARGLPAVDTHRYARENGWAIEALAEASVALRDPSFLEDARTATAWVEAHRALPGGGFRHDEADAAGPYLADTLAMGRAYLALYRVTKEPAWLAKAEAAADFLAKTFPAEEMPGFVTAAPAPADRPQPLSPVVEEEENISIVRFAAQLWRLTGKEAHLATAARAMRFVASPDVARAAPGLSAGLLLADDELRTLR